MTRLNMTRLARFIAFVLVASAVAAGVAGCAMWGKEQDPTKGWSAQRLYDAAKGHLDRKDYQQAIEYYEKLDVRYPFGPLATQGQLDVIYAYYKSDDSVAALAAADRFIKLHPSEPSVDYAYYLKGLVRFTAGDTFMDRIVERDMAQHDPSAALQAFRAFDELVQRFPASRYAEDARQRMRYLKNILAAHEVTVARYYAEREAWLAAANRARYVVENYQRTPVVPEALEVMVMAYREIGLDSLANDASRVLRLNYPNRAGNGVSR